MLWLGELPNPLSHPNINNPFRQNGSMKMPLEKNFGLESFKNGMTSSTKDERRPEESLSESKSHDNSGIFKVFGFKIKSNSKK